MEALDELQALLPVLEEYASDSNVASTIKSAKEKIKSAEANIPQAKAKFAAEPLRAELERAASALDVCPLLSRTHFLSP